MQNRVRSAILLVISITWLITGCRTPAPSPSPTAAPPTLTFTRTVPVPSATTTWIPAVPTLTRTSFPTSTSLPAAASPTPDIARTLVAVRTPVTFASYLSPDGEWRADLKRYECSMAADSEYMYEELHIVRTRDNLERVYASQVLLCAGLGAVGLGGLYWSLNSHYFYFTDAREGVPDGLHCYWERPLLRVDVMNGIVEEISPGPLSPDGKLIAAKRGETLVLLNVDGGDAVETSVLIPGKVLGPIAWSPDGSALVYLQTDSDCFPYGQSYVIRLNLPGLEQFLLIDSGQPAFRVVLWEEQSRLRLIAEDGKEWRFDLTANTLTAVD